MSRHVFLVPAGHPIGRWGDAFGTRVRVVHAPAEALRVVADGDVLWADFAQRDWLSQLRSARPGMVLVATSLTPALDEGMAAFEAGARGYCHALATPEMLRQVATVVANGGLWVGPELMQKAARAVSRLTEAAPPATGAPTAASAAIDTLTHREREVAREVAGGASNKEIAQRLDISLRTVKAHMGAIFDKLAVRDRLQMVVELRRAGLDLGVKTDT